MNESEHVGTMDDLENLDFDGIEHLPWAMRLWPIVQDHAKKGFLHWCKIAEKMVGSNEAPVNTWTQSYLHAIDETFYDLIMDLDSLHTKTIDNIQTLLAKWQQLCLELDQKMPPKLGQDKLSLFEEHSRLKKIVTECEDKISSKKNEIENLNKKQKQYCEQLGMKPQYNLSYPPLPTPEKLEEFHNYIEQLEHEKFEREERFCMIKEDIARMVGQLQYKPNTEFENQVVGSDNFSISVENMEKLNLFHSSLKSIKQTTLEEISYLRTRVEDLWKMLEINLMDRDEFRSHYTENSLPTLEALRVEVKRCEEIRKTNVKAFVERFRADLEELWIKCHQTDEVKKLFQYFHSECYTEDLLDLHEIEIQKWKEYYQVNEKLLQLLEKHKELWDRAVTLEENAAGPNRYKNRGGKLLQEEKERNKLSKMIPKIEEEILTLSEEYENVHKRSFLSFGRTAKEYIDSLYAERENAKKLKLSARKMQRDNLMPSTPGKSAMSLFPSTTPSVLCATKRKILGAPASEHKRLKQTPKNPLKPKSTPATLPTIKITYAPMTLPKQKRRSRTSMGNGKHKNSRRSKTLENTNTSKNTTYGEFQNELSSRSACRSTIMNIPTILTPSSSATPHQSRRTPAMLRTPKNTKLSACKTKLQLKF